MAKNEEPVQVEDDDDFAEVSFEPEEVESEPDPEADPPYPIEGE